MESKQSIQKAKPLGAVRGGTRKSSQQREMKSFSGPANKIVDGSVVDLQRRYASQRVIMFKDIVPPRVFTRLKFILNRLLTSVTPVASIQFNANGIFDFDPAIASNPVAGFDELAFIWGRYRVYGVRAKATFAPSATNLAGIANLGFESEFYTANTKNVTNFDGPNQVTGLGNFATPLDLKMSRNGLAVVGDNIVYTEFSYTGTSASNPSSLWYVSIAVDGSPCGAATVNTFVRAEFEIEVEWFERLDVDSSLASRLAIAKKKETYFKEKEFRRSMGLSSTQ